MTRNLQGPSGLGLRGMVLLSILLGTCLSACGARGEYPSLADIPSAPAEVTPMEERRSIAEEMVQDAAEESDNETEGDKEP